LRPSIGRGYGRIKAPNMPATDVRLLGPLEVTLDGRPVKLGATKQRALLTMLALRPNAVVSVDELVDGLWGQEPPASAVKLIQHYVSQLRKLLAGGDAEIVTRGRGYQLRVRPDAVDVADFERLADAAARNGENGAAARRALSLWRGSPLLDVIDEPFAAAEQRRLGDLWLNVNEHAIAADIVEGRQDEVIARLEELVERHPLRERLHALRMRALYAAGRQAEALEAFRHARSLLVDEIGVEPGPELQRLHEAMLRQEPGLIPPSRPWPRSPARRRLPRALVLAAAVALLAGVAAFAVSRITAPDSLDGIDENTVGQIDTAAADVVAQYLVGHEPRALAAAIGSVWVVDAKDETVSRLEPSRNRVVTIPVGSDPVALAFGDGALWVAERGDGTVAQISPQSNKVIRRIESVNAPSALAVGYGSVWIGSAVDHTVARVRPDGSQVVIHLGAPPSAIAIGAGAVWITSEETGTLFRVEPRTGSVVHAIRVGNRPVAVAARESEVWVVNRQDATVSRIDAATNSVSDTITVARDPGAIALSASDAWVATGNAEVARLDRRARRIVATVRLGNPPSALASDGESVWVATQTAAARHRGGTVTVGTGSFFYPYLEPGAYDPQAQQILSLAYDGLVAYRRTGGTTFGPLVGDLAGDVPEPSADGRTYVFTLRRGIRFSDGTPIEPEDFRASLEDLLQRHGKRLPNFFDAIIGAQRCVRVPRACDLSSGIITDARERTIALRLTRPDPYLLYKLASPLAYVAPAEHPFRPGDVPPGTGPYRVDAFNADRGVELTRNPRFRVWSQDARPDGVADRIRVRVSEDPREQLAAVERGDLDAVTLADAFGASIPTDEIKALFARHPERLHTSATPSLFYLWMNVHEPPFDDVRVRRALNYAVDRELVAELEGGEPLALPACHHVAPGHPGYAPECEYTRGPEHGGIWRGPDIERARALIERSRTAGRRVTVSVPSDKLQVGRYIARLLEQLGYRSRLRDRGEYGDFRGYVANSRNGAQVGTDGWAADFPTPTDFTTPFRCDSYTPRSPENVNLSEYCNRGFERQIDAALRARGAEADALWHGAYLYLARTAPAAPLVNRRGAVFVSERLGNYQHHPLFGVLLDQVWVH
jgi:peptide/nickel transport system substrate-binding protein